MCLILQSFPALVLQRQVTFKELMFAVEEVAKLNIVGFDVNELSPVYDQTGRSTALACKLLREILLYFYK